MTDTIGVLLLTYGSPATLADVPQYLANVRGGRPMPAEELHELEGEFTRRYDLIGGSPLIARTQEQAAALQEELTRQSPDGPTFRVGIGMRFSEPTVAQAVRAMAAAGVNRIIGIIMSPQYSPIIMGGYHRALDSAVAALGSDAPAVTMAGAWYDEPLFQEALAERVRQGLDRFPPEIRGRVPVLFSAHSMPKRVTDQEPEYIEQLQETAHAIAARVGLPASQWMFCYQSAGHEPGEWLKPDFKDIMPELAQVGHREVLMAPVQFLADHLEILYDIDYGAREEAEREGITFARIESLNTAPLFIRALAAIVTGDVVKTEGRRLTETAAGD
ncbi:MAG: ferrochelatase [Chloroflexota bacterium]|nr:ferrochelatase [Chloroflexota bacterium]